MVKKAGGRGCEASRVCGLWVVVIYPSTVKDVRSSGRRRVACVLPGANLYPS